MADMINPNNLNVRTRPASLDVRGQQPTLFPFDAFEFDDPAQVAKPRLYMKEPWVFAVSEITFSDLSSELSSTIESTSRRSEENELKISNSDGNILLHADQIKLQAEEILLQAGDLDDLANDVATNTSEISLNADEIDIRVKAVDSVGDPLSEAAITMDATGTEITNTLRSTNFIASDPFEDRVGWQITEAGDAEFNTSTIRLGSNSEGKQVLGDTLVIEDDELTVKTGKIQFKSPNYDNETSSIEYVVDTDYEGFQIGDFDNTDPTEDFGILTTNRGTSVHNGLLINVKEGFTPTDTYQDLAQYIEANLLYGSYTDRGGGADQAVLCGFGEYTTSGPSTYETIRSYGLITFGYPDSVLGYSFKAFWGTSFTISGTDTTVLPAARRILFT